MKKGHLGPQLSVWIMQVSIFSSVHINRFHCMANTTLKGIATDVATTMNVTLRNFHIIITTCKILSKICVLQQLFLQLVPA